MESPILLVGTAHVVDLAAPLRRVLSDRALMGIALELDAERGGILLQPGPNVERRGSGGPIFLRLWAAMQHRLGEQLGEGAGAEMRAAAELAREWKIPVFLIDDPIRETIARLLRSLSVRERVSLFFGAIVGLVIPPRIVEEQIGNYQERPGELLEELRGQLPGVTRVLLDDRNEHMADRLAQLRAKGYVRIAAVVGDAHVPGLAEALGRRGVPTEQVPLGALLATAPSTGGPPGPPST